MILVGSLRSIVVKVAYQSGFKAPLTVTLLSFVGKSLSLFVYWVQKPRTIQTTQWRRWGRWFANKEEKYDVLSSPKATATESSSSDKSSFANDESRCTSSSLSLELGEKKKRSYSRVEEGADEVEVANSSSSKAATAASPTEEQHEDKTGQSQQWSSIVDFYTNFLRHQSNSVDDEIPNGSNHGLSPASEERIQWIHRVPFYVRPAIPAILALLASALRWTSLVYIDASVVEMMVAGLELTLSVVAARIFRKRVVDWSRWAGVVGVAVGVIIIERGNSGKKGDGDDDDGHTNSHDVTVGVILIVIQSMLSVLQDLAEEIFMQAQGSRVPATMMLGIEGLYGFVVGMIILLLAADTNNLRGIEDTHATIAMLLSDDGDNARLRWWLVGLPCIFLVTGIFNIKATEITSAMTRNIWKTLRTVLVWMIALTIYYLGNNPALGESWHVPESFVILFGFMVMSGGILVYYS